MMQESVSCIMLLLFDHGDHDPRTADIRPSCFCRRAARKTDAAPDFLSPSRPAFKRVYCSSAGFYAAPIISSFLPTAFVIL
jgi:hypothetical protein